MSPIIIRQAGQGNPFYHEGLTNLIMARAIETNEAHLADRSYASEHALKCLIDGPCFFAETSDAVVGVITAEYVDLAYRAADALELSHTYVLPAHRRYSVVSKLFDALEAYADEHRLPVCFHELNWSAAINDEPSEGHRVEKLYQFRKYAGPIILSGMRYPAVDGRPARFRQVGRAYLYQPKACPPIAMPPIPDVLSPQWMSEKPETEDGPID